MINILLKLDCHAGIPQRGVITKNNGTFMETITDLLTTNKILIIIIILIASCIIYYMLKGVFKIVLIIAIALILYYLYTHYNEKKNFDSLQQQVEETIKEFNEKKDKTDKIIDLLDKAKQI